MKFFDFFLHKASRLVPYKLGKNLIKRRRDTGSNFLYFHSALFSLSIVPNITRYIPPVYMINIALGKNWFKENVVLLLR